MIQFLTFTGVRKGEMAHLEWRDVDWVRRQIHIQPKKYWSPKSARPRTIEINAHAMEALKEANRRNEKRVPPSSLVFPGRKGYLGNIRDGLNHACDKAGIKRVTVHQLRHTCASLMVMKGSDLPSVAATLGHRDITTTMIYAHLTQDHIKSQMNKLDGVAVPEICPKSARKPKTRLANGHKAPLENQPRCPMRRGKNTTEAKRKKQLHLIARPHPRHSGAR